MIIANIIGGLGNQMFQFAANYALAKFYETELLVDLSDFNNIKYKSINRDGFLLDKIFNLNVARSTFFHTFDTLNFSALLLPYKYRIDISKLNTQFYKEKIAFDFDKKLYGFKNPKMYTFGYWQNERYFISEKFCIKKIFSFNRNFLSRLSKETEMKLSFENSISIHVRRGDYVHNNTYNKIYRLCDDEYFKNAISIIKKYVPFPVFYVFTDDPYWVKSRDYFNGFNICVNGDSPSSWDDMFLMSKCRHNIISNSSFSWWAAWLNNSKDKIVISPEKWFINGMSTYDLIPQSWIKI